MKKKVRTSLIAALILGAAPVWAQTEQVDLYELSLEELMNVSVVSASKEKERLFDAPVAAYTVTREEISRAGVLSIPEALRLIPGVVVREVTSGNYDIHLRGFDNPAKYTYGQNQVNTVTLLMINNRPVFNYNSGGTFWESLPVDLADIERIEVVAGPSAPLFGPNAVTGVINIITREFTQKELLVSGQVQRSLPTGFAVGSLALGKQVGEKLSIGVTGNYQERLRTDDQQYLIAYGGQPGGYVSSEEFRSQEVDSLGLTPERSLLRKGLNAYVNYRISDNIQLDYSAGIQAAEAQRIMFTTITTTNHTESNSMYSNLSAKIHDLSVRMSYVNGDDELHKLSEGYTTKYDYNVFDLMADYEIKAGDKLRFRPSFNYQTSEYTDLAYLDQAQLGGLLNADRTISSMAGSLRADYTPIKGLRLIGSGRVDKFDVNEDYYFSYQFASTYAVSEKLLVRAVHGKSYSGIFYNYAFIDATVPTSSTDFYVALADKNIRSTANTMTEVGVRFNVLSNVQLDVTAFTQKLEDVSLLTYLNSQQFDLGGSIYSFDYHQAANLPFTLHQNGLTASVNWMASKDLQFRPFVTIQATEARNFDFYNNPHATGVAYTGKEVRHESTPTVYGGWYLNYAPLKRLNINTSAYFFGAHHVSHQTDLNTVFVDGVAVNNGEVNTEGDIAAKMLINAKASYLVVDKLSIFVGGKNLLNKNSREYYGTDRVGSQYFGGVSYNF